MKAKISVGDEVQVISGSDKGRKGVVLDLDLGKFKIRVKDVRVQTCFDKKEGMQKREGFIDYSNVKLVKKASSKSADSKKDSGSKKTGLFGGSKDKKKK